MILNTRYSYIDEKADFLHIDIKDGNYVKTFGVGPDFMTGAGEGSPYTDGRTLNGKTSSGFTSRLCAEAGAAYITPAYGLY